MQDFKKTIKQIEATKLHGKNSLHTMLYGGSRSGKTFISVRNIILRALKCKSRHLILRLRFNHLITSIWHDTLPKVLKICFDGLVVKWNKSAYFIEFENGSQIWFGGLDDRNRVEKILGNEYSTIYLNECSQLSYDAVNVAITRLAEKSKLQLKMYYDCNPPSKSHWTYKLFKLKLDPATNEKLPNPSDYDAIMMNPKDNIDNIGESYIDRVLKSLSKKDRLRFEHGEFTSDTDGALWDLNLIIKAQSLEPFKASNIVVSVDPAVTNNENSDLTGIIVLESNGKQANVLADYSLKASPNKWAEVVLNVYNKHNANYIVAEVNQGGDLVESILKSKNPNIHVKKVRASKGKFARAEPTLALYEQNKVHHNKGLSKLEEEMTDYVPHTSKKSPDRLDALVWGLTDTILNYKEQRAFIL